jgi:hypothetical protein
LTSNEYIVYGLLFSLLNQIQSNSEKNQMTSENLAICFVPFLIQQKTKVAPAKDFLKNLMRGKLLVIFFIENYKEIFDVELVDSHYNKFSSISFDETKNHRGSKTMNKQGSGSSNSGLLAIFKNNSLNTTPTSSPTSSATYQVLNAKYNPSTAKYLSIWNKNMYFMKLEDKEVRKTKHSHWK